MSKPTVTVREVGPRDGLQMIRSVMPTEVKLRWIAAMAEAGIPEMEVASFVPPAAMPQMADAAEVVGSVNGGNHVVPTVLYSDGTTATNPSISDVKKKLGV